MKQLRLRILEKSVGDFFTQDKKLHIAITPKTVRDMPLGAVKRVLIGPDSNFLLDPVK